MGGDDSDASTEMSCIITEMFADALEGKKNCLGGIWRAGTGTAMFYLWHARNLGATADGRLAGVPFSQNSSPAEGSSCNGLTARLASVSCYQKGRVVAGGQNISIQPSAFAGDDGLEKLAAILGGFFEMGGLQAQVTSVDTEMLRRAQENPSAYKDLMVRITGYSAVFVDLSRDAQNEIIRREEMRN